MHGTTFLAFLLVSVLEVGVLSAPQRLNAERYCDTLDNAYNQSRVEDPSSCYITCGSDDGYLVVNHPDFVSCGEGQKCLRGVCLNSDWVDECTKQNPGTKVILVHGSPQCTVTCIGHNAKQVKIPAYDHNKCTYKSEDGEYRRGSCKNGECLEEIWPIAEEIH